MPSIQENYNKLSFSGQNLTVEITKLQAVKLYLFEIMLQI